MSLFLQDLVQTENVRSNTKTDSCSYLSTVTRRVSRDASLNRNREVNENEALSPTLKETTVKVTYYTPHVFCGTSWRQTIPCFCFSDFSKDEICRWNIQGRCQNGDRGCSLLHSDVPFMWLYRLDGEWMKFKHNQRIEEKFCKPGSKVVQVKEDVGEESRQVFAPITFIPPLSGAQI